MQRTKHSFKAAGASRGAACCAPLELHRTKHSFKAAGASRGAACCAPLELHRTKHPLKTADARARWQLGQSTVEFMLMLPVLLASYFFVVQMGLYFTTIHYANYGAFTSARGLVGGFSEYYQDMTTMSQLVLNGDVWGGQSAAAGASGASVTLTNFERRVPLPFISSMVPDMTFTASVALGPTEQNYEYVEGRGSDQYDNNGTSR